MSDKDKKRLILFGGIGVLILLLLMLFTSSKAQGATTVQSGNANPLGFPTFAPPSSHYAGGDVILGYTGASNQSPWVPPNFSVPGFQYIDREPNTPVYVPPVGSMPLGGSPCGCCSGPTVSTRNAPSGVLSFSNTGAQQQTQYLPFAWGR